MLSLIIRPLTVYKKGDAVVVDLGGGKDGYFSDITRMIFLGAPSQEYLTDHQIVADGVSAALHTAHPGVLAKDVDAAMHKVIEQARYREYFIFRLSHEIGSEVHEPPYLTATSNTVLEEEWYFLLNRVFTCLKNLVSASKILLF